METIVKLATAFAKGATSGRVLALCLSAFIAVMPASMAAAQEEFITLGDGQVDKFVVAPGYTVTVRTDRPFGDIVVGNPNVADVFPLTNSSLYIQGNNSGFTNVAFYDENKNLLGVIDIRVQRDLTELRDAIEAAVPSANVQVTNINDRIRLSGEVKDNVDLSRVLSVANQYAGEAGLINAIRVRAPQQVELDVRVLEVERNAARALGVDLTGTRNNDPNDVVFTNTPGGNASAAPIGNIIGSILEIANTDIDIVINALETKGVARRLANPRLVTTSGTEANFVVGGEVPVQTVVDNDTSTQFKPYGVSLTFTPTVLDDGLINLNVVPEVSEVDQIIGNNASFLTRRADTTVSLRDGQSFSIAGLLQVNNDRDTAQTPWLGQVPVLGALFRDTGFSKRETDLVIVVTPRLVRPGAPDEPLRSPLDTTRSTDDVELFLMGMLEVDKDMIRAFRDGSGIVGPYGHMIDLEFEDGTIAKK